MDSKGSAYVAYYIENTVFVVLIRIVYPISLEIRVEDGYFRGVVHRKNTEETSFVVYLDRSEPLKDIDNMVVVGRRYESHINNLEITDVLVVPNSKNILEDRVERIDSDIVIQKGFSVVGIVNIIYVEELS